MEPFLKEQPENFVLIGDLALINIGLGDKAAAMALSERAIAANPIEKDALSGPVPLEILARVAARAGEPDRAIAALQKPTLDTVRWCAGLGHAAHSRATTARSNVRSAPQRSALPKTRRLTHTEVGDSCCR
jgi:hypothetical protein